MLSKLLAIALVAVVLAGCSSPPPEGSFANANYAIPNFTGTATITYTAQSGGITDPTGTTPTRQCAADQVVSQLPPGTGPIQPCVAASSQFVLSLTLPASGSSAYTAYLVGGSAGERSIGDLSEATAGTFTLDQTLADEDLTGLHSAVEVRLKGYPVATAPATSGDQVFALNPIGGIKADATFVGTQFTATLSGLPANGTYVGRLYNPDANGGPVTADDVAESFSVKDGAVTFSAKKNVGEYVEFHIHVGDSALNLYKATVKIAE
ncbi:MAG: hypothetical protein AABX89_05965 [Candidatus Thermoplasmatota archaeon]